MARPMGPPVDERLMALMTPEPNSGCWLWIGNATPAGYGKMRVDRRDMLAHRVAYITWRGPIPEGLRVCHKCDVTSCINPDHLFVGTQADNIGDSIAKGRHMEKRRASAAHARAFVPRGEQHWTRREKE